MSWTSITLQVLAALVVIIILYIVTLIIMNIDSLVVGISTTAKPREKSLIIDGYGNVSALYAKDFNTVNPFAVNFIKVPRSVNTYGGAQFTYQFWIKINEANDDLFKDLPIFIKGDNKLYNINLYPHNTPAGTVIKKLPADNYVRCPLIKFGTSWRHLVVQFNTSNSPFTQLDIKMNPDGTPGNRRNLLSLLPINWYLMTFVFEDNFSAMDSSENGIKFSFYLNDTPYQINTASTEAALKNNYLKQNDGNLYLFPRSNSVNGDYMNVGNLTYYNYATTIDEIRKTFLSGPPTYLAKFNSSMNYKPAHITAFNKLDIYNM